VFTVFCKSFSNLEGWAQFHVMRAPEPSIGSCELAATHLFGKYKITCAGFDGVGGPVSYAMNIEREFLFQ
jgi:hypothetical protein